MITYVSDWSSQQLLFDQHWTQSTKSPEIQEINTDIVQYACTNYLLFFNSTSLFCIFLHSVVLKMILSIIYVLCIGIKFKILVLQ